jgi:hypothetical protein
MTQSDTPVLVAKRLRELFRGQRWVEVDDGSWRAVTEAADTLEQLQAALAEAQRVACERVGADPELRDSLLEEFGTTEPDLIREALAERHSGSEPK